MTTKQADLEAVEDATPVVPTSTKPALIGHNFQREDLNELRDAVNYLLSK